MAQYLNANRWFKGFVISEQRQQGDQSLLSRRIGWIAHGPRGEYVEAATLRTLKTLINAQLTIKLMRGRHCYADRTLE